MGRRRVFQALVALIFAICQLVCAFEYKNCPGPITVDTPANSATVAVTWQHPYLTGVGKIGSISQTVSHDPGEEFPIGLTRVNYLAINSTDYRDLQVCTFVITVHDPVPPVFHTCPINVTSRLGPDQTETKVTWDIPQAIDNSKYVQLLFDHPPGSNFTTGSTTVTYTARDKSGNQAICAFPVIVIPFVTTTTAAATTTLETTTEESAFPSNESGETLSSEPGVVMDAPPINWKFWATRGLIFVSVLCVICLAIVALFMFRKYRVIRRLKKGRVVDEETEIYPSSGGEEYDMWEDPPGSPAYQVNPAALEAGRKGEARRSNRAEERPLLVAGGL